MNIDCRTCVHGANGFINMSKVVILAVRPSIERCLSDSPVKGITFFVIDV
jgi:hypothetical protein